MTLQFYKYQGTGNDFIVIDDRQQSFDANNVELIRHLCDRKFGIGSDGLILIRKHPDADFEMVFFNPDGSKSFCGNGSRCAVQFVYDQKLFLQDTVSFIAIDGKHMGKTDGKTVSITVNDLKECRNISDDYFLNTGSPHFIRYVNNLDAVEIITEGRKIRYDDSFKPGGTNVNFVEKKDHSIRVRTYERGVENETLSCGSGVTACALSAALKFGFASPVTVETKGGELSVHFKREADHFSEIHLNGPAVLVYKGEVNV